MIEHFVVENFRGLKTVTVPLKPLTVLIGPNNTGKSSFLDAINACFQERASINPTDQWRLKADVPVVLAAQLPQGQLRVASLNGSFEVTPNAHGLRGMATPIERIRLPIGDISLRCSGYSPAEENTLPFESGRRTAALLDHLLRRRLGRFNEFVTSLRALVPGLIDVTIDTPDVSQRRVELRFNDQVPLVDRMISDGVAICTVFTALAWHPEPPKTILLEEPENGIHPQRLQDVMKLLRGLSEGALGAHPCQVILTTHSPYLLDLADPKRDQVLVFQRNDDGNCRVNPLNTDKLKYYLKDSSLGEIWTHAEEKGLVGDSGS